MLAPNPGSEPAPAKPAEPKRRTITLTNRAPISIIEDDWPVIAQGVRGYEHPADIYSWEVSFRVRREKDRPHSAPYDKIPPVPGRYLIHAKAYWWKDDEGGPTYRVGRLLDAEEALRHLWKHMLEVGEELRSRIEKESIRSKVTDALDACFADLTPHNNG